MNTNYNYDNFSLDILKSFNELINKYQFKFYEEYEGCYILENKHCILRFTFDRGEISCRIRPINSNNKIGYSIYQILIFLNRNAELGITKNNYDYNSQLDSYAFVLDRYLSNVLNGDFSWLEGFLLFEKDQNKMIAFVIDNLEDNNDIKIKFWNGDISWQSDLKKYLNQKKIEL